MQNAAFRIIDANFNRAREALRVMEDYCRFYLNNPALSSRCKDLRHQLSSAISQLDQGRLLASRDTLADVGTTIRVENQLHRTSLAETATAAAKRVSEALRTISETLAPSSAALADAVEKIRYQCYTLEKDIFLAASVFEKFRNVRLYVIVSSEFPADMIMLAEKCVLSGADCIQLRSKNLPADELFACASEIASLCRQNSVLSIVNDRLDVALASGCDGVHLGQHDIPIDKARPLASRPLIFGGSTHNIDELKSSIALGADYVGIGPCFPSPTKPDVPVAGLDYVKQASAIASDAGLPAIAIGGITTDNIKDVLAAGAKAVAVSAAITKSPDPAAACKRFKDLLS